MTGIGTSWDAENQLSSGQTFTGGAAVSTNSYAKQAAAQDLSISTMGTGLALALYPLSLPSGNLTVELIETTDAALTTSISVIASVVVPLADLKIGKPVVVPYASTAGKQYIGARVTAATGSCTCDIYLKRLEDIAFYKSFPKVVQAEV